MPPELPRQTYLVRGFEEHAKIDQLSSTGSGVTSGLCSWCSAGQHELLTPVSARALIGAKQPRGVARPSSGAEFWIERYALPWGTTLPRRGRQQCAGKALARQKCVMAQFATASLCAALSVSPGRLGAHDVETLGRPTPGAAQNCVARARARKNQAILEQHRC